MKMNTSIAWDVTSKVLAGVLTTGLIGFSVWAYKNWLKPFSNRFLEPLSKIEALVNDVSDIKKEVQTNSGSSLKDQVSSVNDNLALLEARQRGLLASLPRAVFETDDQFNWIDVNPAMERLTTRGSRDLELRRWVSYIHEHDRTDVMVEIHHAVQDKRGVSASFRFQTEDGSIPVSITATPIFSRIVKDTVICWSGHMVLDTDQRKAERRTT